MRTHEILVTQGCKEGVLILNNTALTLIHA